MSVGRNGANEGEERLEEDKERIEELKWWKTKWMYEQYYAFSDMCKSFIYWLQAGELPRYLRPGRTFELGNPEHFKIWQTKGTPVI